MLNKKRNIVFRIIQRLKSNYYTSFKTSGEGRIIVKNNQKIKIELGTNAQFILNGNLIINNFFGDNPLISVKVDDNAKLIIENDFTIGAGVKIVVSTNATLQIGGKCNFQISGITGNTIIMAKERIEIGKDFICSWDVFISDSDWHAIEGINMTIPVKIEDRVWIANNCNVLKGTIIGEGSIIASNTKTINKKYKPKSLISGERGIIVRENVIWHQ